MLRSEYYCYLLNHIVGLSSKSVNHYLERKMNYLLTKKPLTRRGFPYIAGGNRTPITRTGILCDILYTTATVLDYLTTEGGFWQGLSLEFWHKKSPDKAWPHPDWIILFLSCAEENRVAKVEGDPIITVFWDHNRNIAFMFNTRKETIF